MRLMRVLRNLRDLKWALRFQRKMYGSSCDLCFGRVSVRLMRDQPAHVFYPLVIPRKQFLTCGRDPAGGLKNNRLTLHVRPALFRAKLSARRSDA